MAEQLITENLDVWASAVQTKSAAGRGSANKLDLYGNKKLRELILELAVRGLLVPQDPNEEPASGLLNRINSEKAQLVKDGKIKNSKALPSINDDEKHFGLPQGWVWSRLGAVTIIVRGITFPASEKSKVPEAGRIACLRTTNVQQEIDWEDLLYIREQFVKRDDQYILQDDIVMSMANSRELVGKVAIVTKSPKLRTSFGGFLGVIRPIGVNPYFVTTTLRSRTCRGYLIGEASQTTNIANISLAKLNPMVVAIPPASEQARIVAKVDELMALCDQLEQQQEASITAHQTLVQTLLDALTKSSEHNGFAAAWARIADHFDTLLTTKWSIDQLKQTILQLAVMGKLVPQNPNDEPAGELLKKIATEKAELVKAGKAKKQRDYVSFAGLDELKKNIPANWGWVRLADIAEIVRGGSPRPAGDPRYYDGDIPFLKVGDVTRKSGKFVEGFNATIKEAGLHKTRLIESRTVLLSNSGATLGIPAICDFEATFNDGVAAFIEKSGFVFDEYLYLYLASLSKWFIDIASRGQGQPNLNTDIIKSTWLALPPLEEQHSIVTKVDELIAICDSLEANITAASNSQLKIADVVTEQSAV